MLFLELDDRVPPFEFHLLVTHRLIGDMHDCWCVCVRVCVNVVMQQWRESDCMREEGGVESCKSSGIRRFCVY